MQTFFRNGILLTFSALLMRTAGLFFQIFLSEQLGASGLGLFSLIMTVYGFSVTLATSGIHHTSMRLIAEAVARRDGAELHCAMRHALLYALSFGTAAAMLLFTLARPIGCFLLHDFRTVRCLRILAISLPFLSITSCLCGYFQAVRRVSKNVFSQVTEQGFHMILTTLALLRFAPRGIEAACICLTAGSCLSEIYSFCVSAFLYRQDRKKNALPAKSQPRGIGQKLLSIALPIASAAYVRSGLVTVEHLLIPRGLTKFGAGGDSALAAYGVLHGMALPLVLFPQVFLGSFCGLLIPEFTEAQTCGEKERIRSVASRVLRCTLFFSVLTAVVLFYFSAKIGSVMYHTTSVSEYIRLLTPLVPVMYLDGAVDSMLKGLGEQLYSMRVNILDAGLSALLVWLLLPRYGIQGYFAVIYFTELLNAALSLGRLMRVTGVRLPLLSGVAKPFLAGVGGVAVWNLFLRLIPPIGFTKPSLFLEILCVVLLNLLFLCTLRGIRRKEFRRLCNAVFLH